ncbi:hypothetical protein [Aromatoleum toluclasticum]|uniref:hypothetical protein n=1 Tax=Aromatoleum toluclasticum TaxID=92003 RepID=UPI00039A07EB|nr:hypothetical protein [Aromatoleum toluclasticum]
MTEMSMRINSLRSLSLSLRLARDLLVEVALGLDQLLQQLVRAARQEYPLHAAVGSIRAAFDEDLMVFALDIPLHAFLAFLSSSA